MRGFLFIAALSALIPFSAQGAGKEAADEKVERLDSVRGLELAHPIRWAPYMHH